MINSPNSTFLFTYTDRFLAANSIDIHWIVNILQIFYNWLIMKHSLHLWQLYLRKLHPDVDCEDLGKSRKWFWFIICFFFVFMFSNILEANWLIICCKVRDQEAWMWLSVSGANILKRICLHQNWNLFLFWLIKNPVQMSHGDWEEEKKARINVTSQRMYPKKNIFQFSRDFYELLSERIITIICCHWDGMRWDHCDCNGQFWNGSG